MKFKPGDVIASDSLSTDEDAVAIVCRCNRILGNYELLLHGYSGGAFVEKIPASRHFAEKHFALVDELKAEEFRQTVLHQTAIDALEETIDKP